MPTWWLPLAMAGGQMAMNYLGGNILGEEDPDIPTMPGAPIPPSTSLQQKMAMAQQAGGMPQQPMPEPMPEPMPQGSAESFSAMRPGPQRGPEGGMPGPGGGMPGPEGGMPGLKGIDPAMLAALQQYNKREPGYG